MRIVVGYSLSLMKKACGWNYFRRNVKRLAVICANCSAMIYSGLKLTLLALASAAAGQKITQNEDCAIFTNGVCLPIDYNAFMPPNTPMDVKVTIKVQQVAAIDDAR